MAQLNNLIVTGSSRFLNKINGQIDSSDKILINNNATQSQTIKYGRLCFTDDNSNTEYGKLNKMSCFQTFYNYNDTGITINEFGQTTSTTLTGTSIGNNGVSVMIRSNLSSRPDYIMSISSMDIHLEGRGTNASWDGTNTSLKAALSGKLSTSTNYAGSSSVGGAATSAAKLTNTSKIGDTNKPVYFTANGVPSAISYTIDKSVPSTAVFTDAKVKQTATTTDANYEVLFSGTADNTTRTEGARKSSEFVYNPNTNALTIGTRASGSTIGYNSFSIGNANEASGYFSYAEGERNEASDNVTHAEGEQTKATNDYAHAEGGWTQASGMASHAEGLASVASGDYAHAEGHETIANHLSQHVFGEFNIADTSTAAATTRGNYVEIVGNGTGNGARSNARTLNWNGNEWIAGTLTQGSSIEIKKNVADMTQEDGDKILNLRPVVFDYKTSDKDVQAERGFIAEEVKEIIPNLVTDKIVNDEGETVAPASLNYIAMIPYLVKVCQRQQKEINDLKQQINKTTN